MNRKKFHSEASKVFEKYGQPLTKNNCRKLPLDPNTNDTIGECTEDFYILADGYVKPAYYRLGDEKRDDDRVFDVNNQKNYWYTHFPVTIHGGFFNRYISHEKNVFGYFLDATAFTKAKGELEALAEKYLKAE